MDMTSPACQMGHVETLTKVKGVQQARGLLCLFNDQSTIVPGGTGVSQGGTGDNRW